MGKNCPWLAAILWNIGCGTPLRRLCRRTLWHEQADLDLTDIPLRIRICLFKPADSPSHKFFPAANPIFPRKTENTKETVISWVNL